MIEIFKALGDENRLRIINVLSHNELCVCEIETMLEMTQTNVSRHLGKLKSAGLITPFKDAQWVHYRISNELKKNEFLFSYLNQQFLENNRFIEDLKRLKLYDENNLNCTFIREDKSSVLQIIKGS